MIELKVESFNILNDSEEVEVTDFSTGNTRIFQTVTKYIVVATVKVKNDKSLDTDELLLNDGNRRVYLENYFCYEIDHNDKILEYHFSVDYLPDKYDNNSELVKSLI